MPHYQMKCDEFVREEPDIAGPADKPVPTRLVCASAGRFIDTHPVVAIA
jgi:hypothetical protein